MNCISFFRNLFLILFVSPLFSQLTSDECLEQLSIFAESAKIKNYQAAYEPWKIVLDNCPNLNVATYQYGELILKEDLVKSTATGTAKKSINKTNFGNYVIPYYNIEEQNRLKPVFEKVADI